MLHIGACPAVNQRGDTYDFAVGIKCGLHTAASGVIHIGLVDVDQVPVRCTHIVAFVFHSTLTEDDAKCVLAKYLVVGQGVLNLPVGAVALLRISLGVVAVVVTREVELAGGCTITAPERLLGTPCEVVLEVVPQLHVERELGHNLMRPSLRWRSLHHCDRVVLLII